MASEDIRGKLWPFSFLLLDFLGAALFSRVIPATQGKAGQVFRDGSWQNEFFRILIFEPPDFLADSVAGFVCEKKCTAKSPGKSPANSSKFYTTKIPTIFLQRGRADRFVNFFKGVQRKVCEPFPALTWLHGDVRTSLRPPCAQACR